MADRPLDDTEAGAWVPAELTADQLWAARIKQQRERKAINDKASALRRKEALNAAAASGAAGPAPNAAAASGAGARAPAEFTADQLLAAIIKQQRERKAINDKASALRRKEALKAAAAGPAPLSRFSEAARASHMDESTWGERLDLGPGVPSRYDVRVSRTFIPRPPSPELRHTSLQTIMDQELLLEMILQQFTHEHARHLLAPTSRQLAASVRNRSIPWKALTEFEFDSEDLPDVETVHELFAQAYPFYNRDALDPYAEWLLEELCRADYGVEVKWEVIFDCIPHEEYMGDVYNPIPDDGRTPQEVTDAYKTWLAKPNRHWDVWDMKTLSDKIQRKCLDHISPTCWQSWNDPPGWCPCVKRTFSRWQAKLSFNIDVNRINSESILARLDEGSFLQVKKKIDHKIENKLLTNWNLFGFALLKECHGHYKLSEDEEWHDNFCDVRDDFERDEGADFEDPDFDDE